MKKIIALILQITLIFTLVACSVASAPVTDTGSASQTSTEAETTSNLVETSPLSVSYTSEDLNAETDNVATSYIRLEGDSITLEGTGATINGSVVTITSAGTYDISGTLNNGQIVVDTADQQTVTIVLNGVNITNSTSAPIYVRSADKAVITLADGTENVVTDGAAYVFENAGTDEPNAAIFSKDDLTINGTGALTVNANYNNGIDTNDDLKITGGTINVNAVNDGIKGRNYIAVKDATISVHAGGDGLQSNNDEDTTKGYVLIEGGTLNITAGMDGIQAETRLTVNAGDINIISAGGSAVNYELQESAKGLKAGTDITLAGGTLNIDAADDAIHSNGTLTMSGADITVASGDDGIHADTALTINDGNLNIIKAYEGLESAIITINGGNIHLMAEDDGVNAAGGNDGSALDFQPPGNVEASGDYGMYINGGYLYVDANGDGVDSNGSIYMAGGTVIVNGPTNDGNGPLDYNGAFNLTGGYLLAVGSSGMAQAISETSTQFAVMYNFETQQPAGTLIHIEAADGTDILTFAPAKSYQSVLLSSPELTNGSTYVVHSGGSSTGSVADGLYSDGTATDGSQVADLTISSIVTTAGAAGGFGPGGGGHGGPRP